MKARFIARDKYSKQLVMRSIACLGIISVEIRLSAMVKARTRKLRDIMASMVALTAIRALKLLDRLMVCLKLSGLPTIAAGRMKA